MKTLKEALRRGLLGFLTGLALSHTLFLLAALRRDLLTVESTTYIGTYLAYGLSAFYFAAISVIYDSKLKDIHKLLSHMALTLPFLPIAYVIKLMPHTPSGMIMFIGFYIMSYLISYILFIMYGKKTRIN